jgi:hypothetical protein
MANIHARSEADLHSLLLKRSRPAARGRTPRRRRPGRRSWWNTSGAPISGSAGSRRPSSTDIAYGEALRAWKSRDRILDDRLVRFKIAADLVTDHGRAAARRRQVERFHPFQDSAAMVHYSFFTQASVSRQDTAWTVVYDNRNLRAYFTTDRNPRPREISLAALDFSCRTPVRILGVRADLAGDVTGALAPYSHAQALAFQWEAAQEVWRGLNGILPPSAPRDDPPTPERAAETLSWFEDLPCTEPESPVNEPAGSRP